MTSRESLLGVTAVIDIGGQDMKYLKIRNGAVDSIAVNDAHSSGRSSFLQTFAETMGIGVAGFAAAWPAGVHPSVTHVGSRRNVRLGSKQGLLSHLLRRL